MQDNFEEIIGDELKNTKETQVKNKDAWTYNDVGIFTTQGVKTGRKIQQTLPVVTVQKVVSLRFSQEVSARAENLVGGRVTSAEAPMADLQTEVIDALKQAAAAKGANAVIGVQFQTGALQQGTQQAFFMTAQGTPVVYE